MILVRLLAGFKRCLIAPQLPHIAHLYEALILMLLESYQIFHTDVTAV